MYFGPRPLGLLCSHCRNEISIGSKEVSGMRVCSDACAKELRRVERKKQNQDNLRTARNMSFRFQMKR